MSPRRYAILASLLVSLLAAAPAAAQRRKPESENWPFGRDPSAGPRTRNYDLYSLGWIGAKAWDADKEMPPPEMQSGQRRSKSSGRGEDVGPKRLVVKALLGGAPGQKAGLKLEDVIVGVDQVTFDKGSSQPLADALIRAESESGELFLKIERGGETLDLKVKPPKKSKDAADPVHGKFRDKLLKQTLEWLADHQQGGGFQATTGGMAGQITMTSLAGLAWIAGGSSLRSGRHKKNLQAAVDFIDRGLYAKDPMAGRGGGANWNQTTWAFA